MDHHRFLTQNFHSYDKVVELGTCACHPRARVFATTDELPSDFKVKCINGKAHNWSEVKLAPPLAHLDPARPSKPTIKRLMKECLGSWYDSHETIPDQMNAEQSMAVVHVPYQAIPPDTHGAYNTLEEMHDDLNELQVVLYRERGPLSMAPIQALTPAAVNRKAYQLYHMFQSIATNPQVLSDLGVAIYAWINNDGRGAWMVLTHCIAPVLPDWLRHMVDSPVLTVLGGLLGNAISQRVFARNFTRGPGTERLLQEGRLAFAASNLLNNAARIQPVDTEEGNALLAPKSITWSKDCWRSE